MHAKRLSAERYAKYYFEMIRSVLFFILTIVLTCCHKDDHSVTFTNYPIADSIKNLAFKPGSYWIFKSNTTNKLDCTYISQINRGFYNASLGMGAGASVEYYSIDYISNSPNGSYSYKNRIEMTYMLVNSYAYFPWENDPVIYSVDTAINWQPFPSRNSFIDSIEIENKIFYRVQTCSFIINADSATYYTVANTGLVRKIIHFNSTIQQWNLIKSNIVK